MRGKRMVFVIKGMKYDTEKMRKVATVKKWYREDTFLNRAILPGSTRSMYEPFRPGRKSGNIPFGSPLRPAFPGPLPAPFPLNPLPVSHGRRLSVFCHGLISFLLRPFIGFHGNGKHRRRLFNRQLLPLYQKGQVLVYGF